MLKRERQQVILDQLQADGVVRVSELAESLAVDPVTIRRDLSQLEREGHLQRIHGGAVIRESAPTPLLSAPTSEVTRRIAAAAAKFIPDESVLFLGPGTLTAEIVPFLQSHHHLTIITNALNAAWRLGRQRRHMLHIIGGQVGDDLGIYGDPDTLRRIRAERVILEADGLDAERGLTHDDREAAALMRTLFSLSAQTVVLISPERLGKAGALFVAPAGEVDVLITGREADNARLWDLSELGVRLVLT
jgi:DeoR family transcriptional regulator, fructose operon transcriptional repressor